MIPNWSSILKEILHFKNGVAGLSPEALDVLYNCMIDLKYEYPTVQECMEKEKNSINILMYATKKLRKLVQENEG